MKDRKKLVRIICLILVAVMVLGLIPAIAFAAGEQTILFSNSPDWATVYIYYWSDANKSMTSWPGKPMTHLEGDIYYLAIPSDAQYVIFTDGQGTQTADLPIPQGKNLYTYSSNSWSVYEDENFCVHTYDGGTVTTPPTCTSTGVKTYTCTKCGDTRTESVEETDHHYENGICTDCGAAKPMVKHVFYKNADGWSKVDLYYWSDENSGMIDWPGTPMTVHEGDIWTGTVPAEAQYVIFNNGEGQQTADLTLPGNGYLYADGQWTRYLICSHSYGSGVVTKDPTCEAEGERTFACTECGETYTEAIPATGHSYENGSCTVCGMKEECAVHTWDEGTVTQEATCWVAGSRTYTCTVCQRTKTETIPGGHKFYVAEVIEPTCTKTGKEKTKCYGCAYVADKTLPKIDHSYTVAGETVAATCTTDGYTVYTCSGCTATQNKDMVYHTGHKWSGNTCTTCGEVCDHEYVDGICGKCDAGSPAYVEGWYEIATAAQLRWFAAQVNSGNNGIFGRLVADIDLKGAAWTAIGYYCSDTLEPDTMPYTGTFDGQGHTVSDFVSAGTDNEGLFGYCESATIMNLGVIGAKVTGWRAGAVAGYALTSNVIACYAKDCVITGKTTNSVALLSGTVYIAPVTCPQSGTVSNCYALNCQLVDGTDLMVETSPVGGLIRQNNYYCNVTFSEAFTFTSNCTEVTPAQLQSGEVTYRLNKGVTDGTQSWYQTCGTGLPAHTGLTVYQTTSADGTVSYINDDTHTHTYEATVTAPTCTTAGKTVYRCACGDSYTETIPATGHSYVGGTCTGCGQADPNAVTDPGLTLNYPTLSFEDEIIYNVYFSVKDTTSVVEMGLMILPKLDQAATIEDATALVPGYVTNGVAYLAKSEGVPAANMGDTLYFKVYAKLTDGSYAYSGAGGYNAKAYANSILSGNNTTEMKALVVSMLNYGAEAQLYFGHNTDKLVNSALTAEQQALVKAYESTMMDAIVKADSAKTGDFVRVNSNFKSLYPSVSFDGAFAINFYCQPAITVDSGMTLYYWDMETMASVEKLSVSNATGSMEMTDTNGMYWGQVAGIAAKEMDKTYYVTCVFESNGETITTGIIPYSLGKYCSDKAAADGDAQQSFAQATAVYGYYAKAYFASIA